MRGIKPFKLSFITRPFQYQRQNRLGIGVLAYFDLGTGSLRTDIEMWSDVPNLLGADTVDVGMPKSRAEFLVVGSAHQPNGVPGPVRRVRAAVGQQEKVLYVVGDRQWTRDTPTEPAPFVEMPLTWENAFGGEGYPQNPKGKGAAPVSLPDGATVHPLPNVELPGQMIRSPKDRPPPASFGPIDFTWPQRFSLAGTYDREWIDTLFPGLAKDIDWRIWNLAAPDQQREQPFVPGEPIVLEHLHPQKPRVEGRIPELTARCFVRMRSDGAGVIPPTLDKDAPGLPAGWVMEEVELRLTTLWLFPSLERGILVWHGAQPCQEDDGADVDVLMIAAEPSGAPRSLEHYRRVMEKRTGPGREVEVLNDDDLVPPGQAGMGGEVELHAELTTPKNLAANRLREEAQKKTEEARARVVAAGLDPDEHGPPAQLPPDPEVPPLEQAASFQQKVMEQVAQLRQMAEAERAKAAAEGKAFYEEVGLDWSTVEAEKSQPSRRGPPTFSADAERASMRKLADEARASGTPVDELEFYATDDAIYQRWKQAEEQEWQAYRETAHQQWPAFPLSEAESAVRREGMLDALRRGQSMAAWNLTGADLSGLDLAGADLRGALMEATNLQGARLAGAALEGAVLAHANLEQASLDGARLAGANLGRARLVRASLRGADLSEAILDHAVLEGACLMEARIPRLRLRECELVGADLTGAELDEALFEKVAMRDVCFARASLRGAHFIQVTLPPGLDLSGADLSNATLIQLAAPEARLAGARLSGLRFIHGGSLEGADLRGADLTMANLRGVRLARADLGGARLDKADVSEADFTDASLSGIRARDSLWIRAILRNAFLVNADLFQAMLSKADVRGADLRGANLYGADFSLVHGDEATNVSGAIMDRVRAKPVRTA